MWYSGTVSWLTTGSQRRLTQNQWRVTNALTRDSGVDNDADDAPTLLAISVWWSGVDAAIAEAPMKTRRPLGLGPPVAVDHLGVPIDIAVLILANHLSAPGRSIARWVGVAVEALVTIAAVLTYRGITVASALAWWVWDRSVGLWDSSPARNCSSLSAVRVR